MQAAADSECTPGKQHGVLTHRGSNWSAVQRSLSGNRARLDGIQVDEQHGLAGGGRSGMYKRTHCLYLPYVDVTAVHSLEMKLLTFPLCASGSSEARH